MPAPNFLLLRFVFEMEHSTNASCVRHELQHPLVQHGLLYPREVPWVGQAGVDISPQRVAYSSRHRAHLMIQEGRLLHNG